MRLLILGVILGLAAGLVLGDLYGAPEFLREPVKSLLDRGAISPDEAASPPAGGGNSALTINEAGLDIIKESEGLRLEAYRGGSQWLIGYGHSRTAREGMKITAAEADRLLREDVAASEKTVRDRVAVRVNRNQFSALVSLAYNLGSGGFARTLVVERLNKGDYAGAADAFLQHDRARIDGELKPVPHLTERRTKERALFLS